MPSRAALPGSIAGALVVGVVSRRLFDASMAAVLLALAVWLLLGEPGQQHTPRGPHTRRILTDRYGNTFRYAVPVRRGIAYSTVVGFVSSFLGVGGGIMHVPLLVRALGFPTHLATATSHFVLAIIAGSGALTHVLTGSFAHGHGVRRAAALSIGVVAGAQAGARNLVAGQRPRRRTAARRGSTRTRPAPHPGRCMRTKLLIQAQTPGVGPRS